ncbi:DUF1760-domain-containing protein [Polyplosphaeria fusca]|uniref:DUF1760-domain-containing protein n=1 Tax=Polyplosphaeria fusca TaxID=682080 RepID=A0A9P4RB03_9PLEO|nr:DUF1760-domain-containing protein [Polyplosphaeria fusca]
MAEHDKDVNPLLAALPPNSDYLSYLTIVEYNLSEENLPVLHQVLQDAELTVNIGWDLVHLLLPLLPASEECLQDIAAKGNPREVILKVTEALRLLEPDEGALDSEDDETAPIAKESLSHPATLAAAESSLSSAVLPPPFVLRFEMLCSLLGTLHQRVKAKYPSRFLSTSLQAVLVAYNRAKHHQDELTLAAIKLVKTLSGTKRPHLPPRSSSGNMLRASTGLSAPDPEAQGDPPSADESILTNRLFQSFLTHVLEDYVLSLSSESQDVPGLAWSSRLMEKFEPQRVVPNKPTFAELFAKEENLKARSAILGQIVALAQDLGVSTSEIRKNTLDSESERQGAPGEEDEPPSSAADIPLSKTGSLILYAARYVKQQLYTNVGDDDDTLMPVFPDHAAILDNFAGKLGPQTIGMEPEPLLDTLLSLGLLALANNNVGEPADDEQFAKYLQTTSLISANCPSPSLRYHAHYLTSTVLRSHPSDLVRLTFIRDTLEHCPYENLKASAVSWLKGETLEANISAKPSAPAESSESSIFATPVALQTISPFMFPDLKSLWQSPAEISESWMQFRSELGFYLAALNFYYLLLTAKVLHENLDVVGLHRAGNIEERYVAPLKQAAGRFREALRDGGELTIAEGDEGVSGALMDLAILEDVIDRVEGGMKGLGTE